MSHNEKGGKYVRSCEFKELPVLMSEVFSIPVTNVYMEKLP
jgi:hypothetical protein